MNYLQAILEELFCSDCRAELKLVEASLENSRGLLQALEDHVEFLEEENSRLRTENWYLRSQLDNGSDYSCPDYDGVYP